MQNSTLSLVIPYTNKGAAVEAQKEGSFNKTRISSGPGEKANFEYFKEKKRRDCTLSLE
jgi:hypothetical protein